MGTSYFSDDSDSGAPPAKPSPSALMLDPNCKVIVVAVMFKCRPRIRLEVKSMWS